MIQLLPSSILNFVVLFPPFNVFIQHDLLNGNNKKKGLFLIVAYTIFFYFIYGYTGYWISLYYGDEIGIKAAWIIDCLNDLLMIQLLIYFSNKISRKAFFLLQIPNVIAINWLIESFLNKYRESVWSDFDYTEIISIFIGVIIIWWKVWKTRKSSIDL